MSKECPCGSKINYSDCCQGFHEKAKYPPKAVDLMRSRFSAFALGKLDYIFETHHARTLPEINQGETRDWGLKSRWDKLEILATNEGGPKDR